MRKRTISQLKKEADRLFSLFIRQRDPYCISCGAKTTQAGHYVSRTWLSLRYHEKNVNGQCLGCNIWRNGNMDEYALGLKYKYGTGILEELKKLKKPTQFKSKHYEEVISKYKLLLGLSR